MTVLSSYRVGPLGVQLLLKLVKAVRLCVGGELGLGNLVEEMCGPVHAVLADVDIRLLNALGTTFTVGGNVKDAALPHDVLNGYDVEQRHTEHLVLEELPRWFVEGLVGTEVVVTVCKAFIPENIQAML